MDGSWTLSVGAAGFSSLANVGARRRRPSMGQTLEHDKMTLMKSILLGSAAGIVAVAGAQARSEAHV